MTPTEPPASQRLRSLRRALHWRPSRLVQVVLSVNVLGALAALAVMVVEGHASWSGAGPISLPGVNHAVLLAVLFALTVGGELTVVRLRRGDEVEGLTLFEAAVVVDALLLPAALAVAVAIAAFAVASALSRRDVFKTVFNLGSYSFSTAVLVAAVTAGAGGGSFSLLTVIGLVVGTIGFALVNLLCLAWVLKVAAGEAIRHTLESWRLSAVMAVGTVALGAVAVAVALHAPLLLPFTLLPAAALTYAYRAAAQESDERERSNRLLTLSHVLAGRLEADELISSFVDLAREAFRADAAIAVLEPTGDAAPIAVTASATGVTIVPAGQEHLRLLAQADEGMQRLDHDLRRGRGRSLITPLDAEGRRLGVFALTTQSTRRDVFGHRDAAVLTPLASALAAGLRGAEHLARVVEETGKLKAVVEHSSDGILVLDGDGAVLVWNPAMAAITGVPEQQASGCRLGELIGARAEDGTPVDPWQHSRAHLTPETPRATVEVAVLRPDGDMRWVRSAHAAVFDGETLVRTIVIVHDVTRERETERLKADFIATVSHELRTPVTPIKGYTDLLRRRGEDFTPEKRRECLDIIADRVAHLGRLVEDLLLASRVSSPASAVHMTGGDLALLTAKAVGDFAVDAERLHVDLPADPVYVGCDPTRVVQVVSNLVSNGLKYSAAGSPVSVRLTLDEETASVSVTDEGRGIPADHLARVFDKFHRVEDPLRMTTGGSGLGLYIARQLAEAMGGSISVVSTVEVGSTFTFTLGRISAEEVAADPTPAFSRRPRTPLPRS